MTAVGCTATDNFFGKEMVPPAQEMQTFLDSSITVKTYTITADSSVSNNNIEPLMGSIIDPFVGRTSVGFFCNYMPIPFNNADTMFGKQTVLDSMILTLEFSNTMGDTTKKFDFEVYEIQNYVLKKDSTHYSNFKPAPHFDPTRPIVKFQAKGTDTVRLHLPRWFFSKLYDPKYNEISLKNPYYTREDFTNDTLFHQIFNGLYFKSRDANRGEEGVILGVNMSLTNMVLFYRRLGPVDTLVKKYLPYQFYQKTLAKYNTAFVMATHDYSYSSPETGGVRAEQINNLTTPVAVSYIQALGGLITRVVINKDQLTKLKEKAIGMGYKNIGIHKAELRWYTPERSLEYYSYSLSRLGLFSWTGKKMEFLYDYDPVGENEGYINDFGGYLSRSQGYYSQNISSHIQRLLSGQTAYYELNLTADYSLMVDPNRTVIGGSESTTGKAPLLVLTYTLIK